jgi:hypothetical protein
VPTFRVELQENSLVFHGHLEDSTEFTPFEAICSESNALNFRPLYSFSWVGMQNLMNFLSGTHKSFRLVGASPAVARTLLLVAKAFHIDFETIDIQVATPAENRVETVPFSDLISWIRAQGDHVFLPDGTKIRGLGHLYARNVIEEANLPPTVLGWSESAGNELLFWFDYISFSRTAVEASAFALKAALILNEEIAHQKLGITRRAFLAYKSLGKEDERYNFSTLTESFTSVQEINDACMEKVQSALTLIDSLQYELELMMIAKEGTYAKSIEVLSHYGAFGAILANIAAMLDNTGAELGSISFSLQFAEEWLNEMAQTLLPACEDKAFNLALMKLKLEPSCSTRGERIGQVVQIKNSLREGLQRCLIAAQQFDSVRQILENRSKESLYLDENWLGLKNGEFNWESIREELLKRTSTKLVTDIEKLSFQYHFPDYPIPYTSTTNATESNGDGFMMF